LFDLNIWWTLNILRDTLKRDRQLNLTPCFVELILNLLLVSLVSLFHGRGIQALHSYTLVGVIADLEEEALVQILS